MTRVASDAVSPQLLDPGFGQGSVEIGGSGRPFSNLMFTARGLAKLTMVIGYLQGVRLYDEAPAIRLLISLDQSLHMLNTYGGRLPDNRTAAYRVKLGEELYWGSFALTWLRGHVYDPKSSTSYTDWRHHMSQHSEYSQSIYLDGVWQEVHYSQAFTGSLAFHYDEDPLKGDWSLHT